MWYTITIIIIYYRCFSLKKTKWIFFSFVFHLSFDILVGWVVIVQCKCAECSFFCFSLKIFFPSFVSSSVLLSFEMHPLEFKTNENIKWSNNNKQQQKIVQNLWKNKRMEKLNKRIMAAFISFIMAQWVASQLHSQCFCHFRLPSTFSLSLCRFSCALE